MFAGRILVVEDDPLWQHFLQEPLEAEYAVTVVSSRDEAKEALDLAQAAGKPFNLVTVDIGLTLNTPALDGEELLAFITQHHPQTKCIVVTGHKSVGKTRLRNYFKEFDVFDFVDKADFDLSVFKEIVDRAFYLHEYRLLAELGRGGMGTVYKARDSKNGIVALKVLHHDPRLTPAEASRRLTRFSNEVETARRLNHPNIVKVFDYVAAALPNEQTFFVMEYLDGLTLQQILNRPDNRLPPAQVAQIGRQLCSALVYAHQQQVIHRDIKPSNIIILPDAQVKLTDFGIAKVLNAGASLTKTEDVLGTLEYMPPEQILQAKHVDQRVDIYAVGAVLYELLSGQKLYPDPMQKLRQDPQPLQQLEPAISNGLAGAIMKAVARDPNQRYQSAAEMAQTLSQTQPA